MTTAGDGPRAGVPVEGGPDAGAVWHYGDPVAEQRAWAAGRGVADLSHRQVVRIGGPDRLGWLDSLTTQRLTDLAPSISTETLVLSPHGHIEHALHVVDDGEALWATVEPGTAAALVAWLDRMRFLLRVEVEDLSDTWAVVGEPSRQGPDDADPLVWVDPWPHAGPGTALYGPPAGQHPGDGWAYREVLVPRERLAERLGADAQAPRVGLWALEALRAEAWRPRSGLETDHRTIPHELDWLRTAVHLDKGCYRGQETVARVHNLGRPPRRLVLLHLDGSQSRLPAPGAPVAMAGESRPVGFVGTVARHHELGPVALAVVKRSTPADAPLLVPDAQDPGVSIAAAQDVLEAVER